jgi:glycosyltransferase involved in cell wall biosynthesis
VNVLSSIAILNPLSDFGISAYSFELAEGLSANGVAVDVYMGGASPISELPDVRRHRCFPVLGSALLKQNLDAEYKPARESGPRSSSELSTTWDDGVVKPEPARAQPGALRASARNKFLEYELAFHLKRKGYDLVWTQWPDIYGDSFWASCRRLGLRTAHTAHNVLPHEESSEDMSSLRRVYAKCDHLILHSEFSREELLRLFPNTASKTFVAPHGLYTIYPRCPEARTRVREKLNIAADQIVCLICGGIRPYKNIDSSIRTLAKLPKDVLLIVAGREAGFEDCSATDALAHTRRVAESCSVEEQVKLIPNFLGRQELAELFEAADILLLPYIKGYGSGLLLLGMTFRKYIVTTDTGGASEYLRHYPHHSLLANAEAGEIAEGIASGGRILKSGIILSDSVLEDLQWPTIVRNALQRISAADNPRVSGF